MRYKVLLLLSFPLFLIYLFLCLFLPIIKFGKKSKVKNGKKFYIIKDGIHSDYLFFSNSLRKIFKTNKKYIVIGWGDRKIFLETKKWSDLKAEDFLRAFYGLNETVLRIEFLDNIPKNKKIKEFETKNFNNLVKHIKDSFVNEKIKKKRSYYQKGEFYKSNLKYNCFTNCNNWINLGLRKCYVSNRIWAPMSFWI